MYMKCDRRIIQNVPTLAFGSFVFISTILLKYVSDIVLLMSLINDQPVTLTYNNINKCSEFMLNNLWKRSRWPWLIYRGMLVRVAEKL